MTASPPLSSRPRVVIVGGGFAGIRASLGLARKDFDVTLVDRENHHLFQPLLYQVATGALSPANIATPLRHLFRRRQNVRVVQEEISRIDIASNEIYGDVSVMPWDYLVLATGSRNFYFGHDDWAKHATGLKSVDDATFIRGRMLRAFEEAELNDDPVVQRQCMTFVIVGGGPTGVEMAGAIAELSRFTLKNEFRRINPADARVVLVEAHPRLLPPFPEGLAKRAEERLKSLGVELRLGALVTEVTDAGVTVKQGDKDIVIASENLVWAAGVRASSLGGQLQEQLGCELDRTGRVVVSSDLSVPGRPDVFVVGDLAHFQDASGAPLPGLAPVALQQGTHVAKTIIARQTGRESKAFKYHNHGSMAVIGRGSAVADTPWMKLSGYPAWAAWLFIHLMYLVQFQNRVLVLMQWGWNYVTRGRSARLITGPWRRRQMPKRETQAIGSGSSDSV